MIKILSWNIQHRTGENLKKLIPIIIEKSADIVVLSEYRISQRKMLEEAFFYADFKYQLDSNPPDNKTNGLFIASKHKFTVSNINYDIPEPSFRWLDIQLEDFNLKLVGVHIPDYNKSRKSIYKKLFWQNLIKFTQKYMDHNVVIIGDFNTGLAEDTEGMPFECSQYMNQLNELGWIDIWRFINPNKKEYTWYHARSKNGFRVDYAYVSPNLKNSILSVKHNHTDRVNNYSDHSSIMLELDIKVYTHGEDTV